MNQKIIFIGAGGHARVVYEAARLTGRWCAGYTDDKVQEFYGLGKIDEVELSKYREQADLILSFGAVTVESLLRRREVFTDYQAKGFAFASIINPKTYISETAEIDSGAFISVASILNSNSQIASNTIINTGAIIEHDVVIGHSSHICPGAIILGGAKVGKCCLIGAGAIILPNSIVPDEALVPANTRFQAS